MASMATPSASLFCPRHEMTEGSVGPPQFLEGYRFDLADSFARDAKDLAGFFECIIRLLSNAEPHADDFFFAWGEHCQNSSHVFLESHVQQHRFGIGGALVGDHVRQTIVG